MDDAAPVVAAARELAALRYALGFDMDQVLYEHEILGAWHGHQVFRVRAFANAPL